MDRQSRWCRNLRLGFVGFFIAATGAGLAFFFGPRSDNPWLYVALVLVASGIGTGFASIARGCYWILTARSQRQSAATHAEHPPSNSAL